LSGHRLDPERYQTLLVHGRLAPGEESMADLAQREGARMEYLPSLGRPIIPPRDARALAGIIRIARRFRPHIIHTHTAKAGFVGRLAGLIGLRPRPVLLHTYHGHVLEGYFGPIRSDAYRRLERQLGRASQCLVGVSAATVDDLVRLRVAPREKFRVIPQGLDLDAFTHVDEATRAALRRQLDVSADRVLLTFVGRMVPIKRLDLLLRALAVARRTGVLIHLAMVGDGETRPDLERLVSELGIAANVTFLGYRRDLSAIAAAADAAVLCSDNEGTGISLIEAAAAGRPAIATDVGGVSEVVTPDSGILVPPNDEEALATAIANLASDTELRQRMGQHAREHVVGRYSPKRLIANFDALYGELLEGSPPDLS
jgi:glycosyltransferase involved in cell wall biosynthesis